MTRPNTPDEQTATGTRITVKRVCDGCHEPIGDVTDQELEEAMAGAPLYSVSAEHGCGWPRTLPVRPS